MRKIRFVFFALALILMVSLTSAGFEIDENTSKIEKNYLAGDFLRGKLNMSFSDQENLEFTDNFNGNKKLFDVLTGSGYSAGEDFDCNPVSCKDDFFALEEEKYQDQIFNLEGRIAYGFKILGSDIESVDSFKFNISSDAAESCQNQLQIDLLNDGVVDFFNTGFVDVTCKEKDFGCFQDDSDIIGNVEIKKDEEKPFCEKIENLPAAPAYKIGAKLEEGSGATDGELSMRLYNIDANGRGDFLNGCKISPTQTGEFDCIANYSSLRPFDAYVCVESRSIDSGNPAEGYEIRARQSSDSCGGRKYPSHEKVEFIVDYEVYAQPLKYAGLNEMEFNDALYAKLNGGDLTSDIESYIEEVYQSKCPSPGCVIPLSIWEVNRDITSQQVTLNSGLVEYEQAVGSTSTRDIYKLINKILTITSGFLILDVEEMKFEVPNIDGKHDFTLRFDGEKIIEEEVNVEVGFDFNIGPRFALLGQRTTFTAFSSENISSSIWDFGDGSFPVTSANNKAQHSYTNESDYVVEVTLTNEKGKSSLKKFRVLVGDAKTSANKTLANYKSRISNIKNGLDELPEWVREKAKEEIGLDEIEGSVNRLNNEFELSGDNVDYAKIVNELVGLDVPHSISVSESGSFPGAIGYDNINTRHLEEISGVEDVADRRELKLGIVNWIEENYDYDIEFEAVSLLGDLGEKDILKKYKIALSKKTTSGDESSFFILDVPLSSIRFKSDYNERDIGDDATYLGISDSGEPKEIEFMIVGINSPDVEELGAYISPAIESLGVSGKPFASDLFSRKEAKFSLGTLFLGIGILIILFLGIYLILQGWYKRYYEMHLFPKSNDLYNVINFIYNSRRTGVAEKEIKKKLSKMKWKGEQITYALKKMSGKRTGMWEIPLFKFLENKKIRKELEKKQRGKPIDTKFIKRPNL